MHPFEPSGRRPLGRPPRDLPDWRLGPRTRDDGERVRRASPAFTRFFVGVFVAAAKIGLVIGLLWSMAGLWHAHVHRLW